MLSEGRIDQHLHFTVQNEIDSVRASLMNLEDSGNRNPTAAKMSRRSLCAEQLESHLVKPAGDRRDRRLVEVIHCKKQCTGFRQAIIRRELRFREGHSERSSDPHDFTCRSHLGPEDRIELAKLREWKYSFLHRDVVRNDFFRESEVVELLAEHHARSERRE